MASWRYVGPTRKLNYRPRNQPLQIVQLSLPEPLLFASSGRQGGGGGSRGSGRAPARAGALKAPGTPRGAPKLERPSAAEPASPRPQFALPPKPAARERDLVIQSAAGPDVRLSGVQLPNLFLWSRTEPVPPRRQLEKFVPGERQRTPRRAAALPDAPPKLDLPNQEVRVADLKIAPAPDLPKRPALPVFQATTAPVRIPRQTLDAASELPVTPLPSGEPTNLLALLERPAPPAATYSVPGGNRIPGGEPGAAGGEAGADAAGGTAGGPGGPGGRAGAGTGTEAGGAGPGRGTGGASGAGVGRGAGTGAGPGTGAGARGAGSGTGSGAGAASAGAGAGSLAGPGSGTGSRGSGTGSRPGGVGLGTDNIVRLESVIPIRTEAPNTAAFDVVVVHQGSGDLLPESPGLLTGQPIYTVYMAVPGSRQEWILQYAVPHSREPVRQRTENSIQVGAATPVRAPYPLRKASIQLGEGRHPQGRVVVYGDISDKGAVENLRVIRGVDAETDSAVMACLRQFQFRPATRDGAPVLVEALFGVPLD